jgi:Ser/Thr protein kinase RdoA (MazF antagonist)
MTRKDTLQSFESLTNAGQLRRLRRLALAALADYGIYEPHLTALVHGDNTTFRVDLATGERYVLRIHRSAGKTPELVRSELAWLVALQHEAELLVPSPVATPDGSLITIASFEGVPEPRICVLFRWISGRFLEHGLTPAHLRQVGAFMARLQLSGARFDPPDGFVRGRLDNLYGKPRGISEALARQQVDNPDDEATAIQLVTEVCSPEDGCTVEKLIRTIRAAQRMLGQGPETFGLIQGDLHQENYLFHHNRVGAIDFDDCGYGYYAYDIAVTLYNLIGLDRVALLRQSFLEGYRSVRELPAEHEQHIETFFYLRDLQMVIWAIEMRNHPAFRDRWASITRETLQHIKGLVG